MDTNRNPSRPADCWDDEEEWDCGPPPLERISSQQNPPMECQPGGRVTPLEVQACRGRTGPTGHSSGAGKTPASWRGEPRQPISMGAGHHTDRLPGQSMESIPPQFWIPKSSQNWWIRENEPHRYPPTTKLVTYGWRPPCNLQMNTLH